MKQSIFNRYLFKSRDFYIYIGCYQRGFIKKVLTYQKYYKVHYDIKKQRKSEPVIIKNMRYKPEGFITKRMTKRNNINKMGF